MGEILKQLEIKRKKKKKGSWDTKEKKAETETARTAASVQEIEPSYETDHTNTAQELGIKKKKMYFKVMVQQPSTRIFSFYQLAWCITKENTMSFWLDSAKKKQRHQDHQLQNSVQLFWICKPATFLTGAIKAIFCLVIFRYFFTRL